MKKSLTMKKKSYVPLKIEVLDARLQGSLVCTSGDRNDYEEENW